MLDEKYYKIISKIINEDLHNTKFNYKSIMDYSYNKYNNRVKLINLKIFIGYLKNWGFVEYKRGGKYPFYLTQEIPLTLVGFICKGLDDDKVIMKELIREHSIPINRKDKIKKLKEKIYEKER
jgi:hypothetical protein